MQRTLTLAVALTIGASAAFAEDAMPKVSVVAEWNSIPYIVKDAATRKIWEDSAIFGKALLQGAKVDAEGTIYASTARWAGKEMPATLSRLVKQGDGYAFEPYPSEEMNAVSNPDGLKAVLGFEIDRNDVMWILDQGQVAGSMAPGDAKLVLWDIKANKEIQRYVFPADQADTKCSFLNDVAVDNDSGFAYITDSGIFCSPLHGGLIVYDSKTNTARRVLDQTKFTNNDPNFFFNIGERTVTKGGAMLTGADGIALSGDKQTLYWTNLTGHTLYSLPTAVLRDFSLSEAEIEAAVQVVAELPSNTDGMTADRAGNIYLTALQQDGLMKYDPVTRRLTRLVHNPEMHWPDTLAWGPDGALYFVTNHLNVWVDGDMDFKDPAVPNFRIWKIDNVGQSYTAQ